MKKVAVLIVVVVLMASAVYAGQVGGMSRNLGKGGLSLSAGIGYVSRDIEDGGIDDESESRQFIVKGSYGLQPNLDINILLGFADLEFDGSNADFNGNLGSLYGVGVKFKLFQDTEDRVNVTLDGGIATFKTEDSSVDADVLEYQAALVISNKAGNMTPYGGIKYSEMEVDFDGPDFEADNHVGLIGGVDYFVNPNVYFNGELHIFDEESIHFGVGYKF